MVESRDPASAGEVLGDPDPTGMVTPTLRDAVGWYETAWHHRLMAEAPVGDDLTRPHGELIGPARTAFCPNLAAEVAALTAEALVRFGPPARPVIGPIGTNDQTAKLES